MKHQRSILIFLILIIPQLTQASDWICFDLLTVKKLSHKNPAAVQHYLVNGGWAHNADGLYTYSKKDQKFSIEIATGSVGNLVILESSLQLNQISSFNQLQFSAAIYNLPLKSDKSIGYQIATINDFVLLKSTTFNGTFIIILSLEEYMSLDQNISPSDELADKVDAYQAFPNWF
ncbi:MAG: hypothetical protein LAT68_05940 [Cyclobacteriaceae bacterium]|nr:hypothetical protein [Cyclobacteriaceae bacterium]MCH8515853.1 hypothetical protein [Cyclobacteriaceae bacterium]